MPRRVGLLTSYFGGLFMAKVRVLKSIDMTEGKPMPVLIRFALPLVLGSLLQQLYNTVDSIVVGREVGTTALASVGTCGPILHLLVGFFIGFSHGATVTVAGRFGARDEAGMDNAVRSALSVTFIFSIVLTIIGSLFCDDLLRLINVPEDVLPGSVLYLKIQFWGVTTMLYYNMTSALLRGFGDSRTPLVSLSIACAINVVLDIVFVTQFGLGVMGVSLATIISQGISAVYGVIMIRRKRPAAFRFSRDFGGNGTLLTTMRIGFPSAFQNSINSVGGMAVQGIINGFGETFIASANIINRMDQFCTTPINSIGNAMSAYTGQNLGAKKPERIKQGLYSGITMTVCFCAFMTTLLIVGRKQIIQLFSADPAVLTISQTYLFTIAPFYICLGLSFLLIGIIRGSGHSLVAMYISMMQIFAVRIPVAYYFCNIANDPKMVYFAMGCGWTTMLIVLIIYFKTGKWRIDVFAPKEEAVKV